MRIPKEFTHKGKHWKVIQTADPKHEDGTDCEGLCDCENRVIILDARLKGKAKKTAFLHELFHVVVFEAHINQGVRFTVGLEEVLCDAFADLISTSFTNIKWKKQK